MKDQESRGTEKHCWGETPGEEEISGQMNPGAGWGGGTGALAVRGHWAAKRIPEPWFLRKVDSNILIKGIPKLENIGTKIRWRFPFLRSGPPGALLNHGGIS